MFGSSVGEIAWNIVRHPSRWAHLLTDPARSLYLRQLFLPVALLPFASFAGLATLLIGAPALLVNLASSQASTYDIHFQYAALIDAAVFLAVIETIGRYGAGRPSSRPSVPGGAAARRHRGRAPAVVAVAAERAVRARVLDQIAAAPVDVRRRGGAPCPPGAGVSATYNIVPHLVAPRAHLRVAQPVGGLVLGRARARTCPTRTTSSTWCWTSPSWRPSTRRSSTACMAPDGEFELVFQRDDILVARRRTDAAPSADTGGAASSRGVRVEWPGSASLRRRLADRGWRPAGATSPGRQRGSQSS